MTDRCAKCGRQAEHLNPCSICGACAYVEPWGDEGMASVFDDDVAWEREQIAEMKGLLDE